MGKSSRALHHENPKYCIFFFIQLTTVARLFYYSGLFSNYCFTIIAPLQVGRSTIESSEDPILKQDMPAALHRVEAAARLLEEASALLKGDPYSQPARYLCLLLVYRGGILFSSSSTNFQL